MRQRVPGGYAIGNPTFAAQLITESGMTAAELARRIGVTRQFLSLLLHSQRTCSQTTARALCRALRVPGHLLFVDAEGRPVSFETYRRREPAL